MIRALLQSALKFVTRFNWWLQGTGRVLNFGFWILGQLVAILSTGSFGFWSRDMLPILIALGIAAHAESADFVQSPLAQASNSQPSSSTLHEARITVRRSPAALSAPGVHEAMEPDPKSVFPDCMCLHVFPWCILSKTAIHRLSPKLRFAETLSHRRAQKKFRLNLRLQEVHWGGLRKVSFRFGFDFTGVCLSLRLNCSLLLLIIVPGIALPPHCRTACFLTCFGTRLPFAHDLWPFLGLQRC